MTIIPQCMHCKNAKIENETVICKKYKNIPGKIANGDNTCEYHERVLKNGK